MSLQEKISTDLKTALKNTDSFRVSVLRLLSASLQNEAISKRTNGIDNPLTEAEVIGVLKREAKKRKESIDIFKGAERFDLSENEIKELAIIQDYLPPEVSREEIEATAKRIMASGITDFPTLIKSVIAEFKGAADGKQVAEIVRLVLG